MDSSSSNDSGIGALIGGILIVELVIGLAVIAFFVWMFWRIFEKAGMSGPLGLLAIIPGFGPLIATLILAFGRWPIQDQLAALQAGQPMPATYPNPFAATPPAPPSGPPATQ